MDELDKFVQDGVFEQHAHTQLFEQGETSEARERWLQNVKSICREAGIGYVVREITKDGKPGYQFGFADSSHHAAFVLNVCGDLESPDGQVYVHEFIDCSREYEEAFRIAAEIHLAALGIEYKERQADGEVSFTFDRFSDKLMLQALIGQGTIETSAKGLALTRAMQHRLNHDTKTGPAYGLGFDPA